MTAARDQIIQTTCDLLEFQGFHATGLNQIIKESGSPKGSLYYYFPGGKEELTAEALNHVGQIVLGRIQTNLALLENPAQAIQEFIANVARNVALSGYRAGGPITTVALETAGTSERLRQECERIYADWQKVFADKLTSGGMDAERARRMSSFILAAIEGGIILCRTQRSPKPLEDVAAEVGALLKTAF